MGGMLKLMGNALQTPWEAFLTLMEWGVLRRRQGGG